MESDKFKYTDLNLRIILKYNISEGDFKIQTNARARAIPEIISNFLELQIGKGKDNSKAINRDEYIIKIELNLHNDVFKCSDNCGNKGLRDGILLTFLDQTEIEGEDLVEKIKYEFITEREFTV